MQTKIEKMYSKKQLLSLVRQDLETLDNWIDILIAIVITLFMIVIAQFILKRMPLTLSER